MATLIEPIAQSADKTDYVSGNTGRATSVVWQKYGHRLR